MAGEATSDSRERIMEATYHALIEKGYADMTMGDIADRSETSTSLLHYHFDTKEDLLVAFLDNIVDRLDGNFEEARSKSPVERLEYILGHYVLDPDEDIRESFFVALGELRGQAPYNERYQDRFKRADRILTDGVADVIREGVEAGTFHEVDDPDHTARLIIAAADGARSKGVALGDPGYTWSVLSTIRDHILDDLFTDDAARRWEELQDEQE